MFFLLFGSSGSGKTVVLDALRDRVDGLAVHDFDEVGVPPGADLAWRHRANEHWVQRALEQQAQGTDLLLAGQSPLGELLAAPGASRVEAISACLLDCDDATRAARLPARGPEWLSRTGGTLRDYLNWAGWMRAHAADPASGVEMIRCEAAWSEMRWSRWSGWCAGDGERALFHSGAHPLRGRDPTP